MDPITAVVISAFGSLCLLAGTIYTVRSKRNTRLSELALDKYKFDRLLDEGITPVLSDGSSDTG